MPDQEINRVEETPATKEERFKKWCAEHPTHPIVLELKTYLEKKIRKEASRNAFRQFIKEKRDAGLTWEEIGEILGVSRQAVFAKNKKLTTEHESRRQSR